MIAAAVNHAWWCAAWSSWRRMRRALGDPQRAQAALLMGIIRANATTAFGRSHGFAKIESPEEFVRCVPIRRYDEYAAWIDRVAAGEPGVLTTEPVRRLLPSSGSTAARKLVPFTPSLGRQFRAAVGPWIVNLFRGNPDLARGPAYWSITPGVRPNPDGRVPIGFDDDSAYLGGTLGRLVRPAMVVAPEIARIASMDAFRYATLLSLLRRGDLRIVSVWHPSFLTLLLARLPPHWDRLVADVEHGSCSHPEIPPELRSVLAGRPNRARARHLGALSPSELRRIWTSLGLVSCWADAGAGGPARVLHDQLPHVRLQPKGLLATEGVVSFPLGDRHPLAVRSHFLEFLDDGGEVHSAHQLRIGECYEVLVTTGGGLYRYRLGDRIRVDGLAARTPSVRFVGRTDGVSDLVGEKFSEAFVGGILERWCERFGHRPSFAMLAPGGEGSSLGYSLFIEENCGRAETQEAALDLLLRENPHYDLARRLGQLAPVRLMPVRGDPFARYSAALVARGMRLGDIKPTRLSADPNWSKVFRDHIDCSDPTPAAQRGL